MLNYTPKYNYQILNIDDLIVRINKNIPFAYSKINHGFWENMLKIPSPNKDYSLDEARIIDSKIKKPYMFENGFAFELFSLLKKMPINDPNFMFAISPHGWKNGDIIEGTPAYPHKTHNFIHEMLPQNISYFDGLDMKNWMLDKSIVKLFESFKEHPLIIIGPNNSGDFGKFIEHDNYEFIPIHASEARKNRKEIEEIIIKQISSLNNKYAIVLFQAGILTPYWISRLYQLSLNVALIDMGLALDIHDPKMVFKRNWGRAYRSKLSDFYKHLNPELVFPKIATAKAFDENIENSSNPSLINNLMSPVKFIENKPIDNDIVNQLLQLSTDENHWANGGPVSRKLERAIHDHLKLSKSQSVVMCANCTVGLDALANLVEILLEKKPTIVVSSFGFFSTQLGPYKNANIVDCNQEGFLDCSLLELGKYDAFVYTNVFGLKTNISDAILSSELHDTFLIVDNAAGFNSLERSKYSDKVFEAISFHHTKPFGFGEGGCMIIPTQYESIIRSLINFGVGLENDNMHFGTNGKISDISCAYIYQRLRTMDEWGFFYGSQARRITHIAENAGLKPLVNKSNYYKTLPGQLPFLSTRTLFQKDLENDFLQLRKYYIPHDNSKNANDIYDRIVNVPTHGFVKSVSDDDLYDVFKKLL